MVDDSSSNHTHRKHIRPRPLAHRASDASAVQRSRGTYPNKARELSYGRMGVAYRAGQILESWQFSLPQLIISPFKKCPILKCWVVLEFARSLGRRRDTIDTDQVSRTYAMKKDMNDRFAKGEIQALGGAEGSFRNMTGANAFAKSR